LEAPANKVVSAICKGADGRDVGITAKMSEDGRRASVTFSNAGESSFEKNLGGSVMLRGINYQTHSYDLNGVRCTVDDPVIKDSLVCRDLSDPTNTNMPK
jgi:hypothetical protein